MEDELKVAVIEGDEDGNRVEEYDHCPVFLLSDLHEPLVVHENHLYLLSNRPTGPQVTLLSDSKSLAVYPLWEDEKEGQLVFHPPTSVHHEAPIKVPWMQTIYETLIMLAKLTRRT